MNLDLLHKRYVLNSYASRSLNITHGFGCYLFDEQGNKYLDMMTNYGVNIFGHSHPEITQGLAAQLSKLTTLHGSFKNDIRTQAAKSLVSASGGLAYQVYFSNSGAEAVEAGLKFALIANSRKKILAFTGSYHGKTLGALSVTASKNYKLGLEPHLLVVEFLPFNDTTAIDEALDENTCCVIVEPIQGEAGINQTSNGFLSHLSELCKEKGTILICDEIQTGTGRTGKFLNSHYENIEPDIVCLGKGLGGGIPVGATIVSQAIADSIPSRLQTSTFGGNPLACRGIVETLKLLTPATYKHITEMGHYFKAQLEMLNCGEVRGAGLMLGVECGDKRNVLLKALQNNFVLACPAGDTVIRFLPSYIITKTEIDVVIWAFRKALSHV